ncbi:MAG: hypothetical protein L0229_13820 [Blastocatellia bacterium]|nr:hypothetical protein [Blastocatellia bacterium]
MEIIWDRMSDDVIEVYEEMLYQRASQGIRPVLYVSSFTDFECSLMMLLDNPSVNKSSGAQPSSHKEPALAL